MRYATLCFFGGIAMTYALDALVHVITDCALARRRARRDAAGAGRPPSSSNFAAATAGTGADAEAPMADGAPAAAAPGRPDDAPFILSIDEAPRRAGAMALTPGAVCCCGTARGAAAPVAPAHAADCDGASTCSSTVAVMGPDGQIRDVAAPLAPEIAKNAPPDIARLLGGDDHLHLSRMSLLSAIAIFVHNLPEGLATFIGALADPRAGVAIAVAIALHNIPEGVVVAMPVYYATGSRWKGFWWAFLSGVSEPVGGLLGYAVLSGRGMDPTAFAVLFGLVAGMMVFIALNKLLPTALSHDPRDRYTTSCVMGGMAVMAASLLLFAAA
jgi:ZIP family zinc transporter